MKKATESAAYAAGLRLVTAGAEPPTVGTQLSDASQIAERSAARFQRALRDGELSQLDAAALRDELGELHVMLHILAEEMHPATVDGLGEVA